MGVFPIAEGWLSSNGDSLGVTLRDVEFVDELKTILPADVRRFWEDHRLAGRIDETRVSYFKKADGRAGFKVETDLDGVRLIVPPQQWLGPVERQRADAWRTAFATLSTPALGASPVAKLLAPAMTPKPLQLDEVDGTFVFTDAQITIRDLVARAEANRFKLSGVADGYDASAPFRVRVQSLASQDVVMPESPTYISALPWPVQEIYYRFSPRGAASFWVDVERKSSASGVALTGELSIHDAAFRYEELPYPIDRATGKLRIGQDPTTGHEVLEIVDLAGRGYKGGLNENAAVHINGRISPLDETAGADIVIRGKGIRNEPRLLGALSPQARSAVLAFDAHKTGMLPTFTLDFETVIRAPVGRGKAVTSTTLDLHNAAGVHRDFPYPLTGVAARLVCHEGRMVIDHVRAAPGGGTARLSGEIGVDESDPHSDAKLSPDLRLEMTGVPIDETLLTALPPKIAAKLREADLRGVLDLNGTIKSGSGGQPVAIDFDTTLRSAAASFANGSFAFDHLTASAKLTNHSVNIPRFDAHYGNAGVEGNAIFDWDSDRPGNAMAARIVALPIDDALINKLPERVRPRLKALGLAGTVDAEIEASGGTFRAVVRPRKLSLTRPACRCR
jgi:hypothetical protein